MTDFCPICFVVFVLCGAFLGLIIFFTLEATLWGAFIGLVMAMCAATGGADER